KRQHETADVCLPDRGPYRLERNVTVVRSFVISPAHVEPHPLARHVAQRPVDRRDDALHETEELALGPALIRAVPLEREVGAIDLQAESRTPPGFVLAPQRLGERGPVLIFAAVVVVLACGGEYPRRRRRHERL